ncbi:MAG: BlaI/MecI/CopY family transcriptional regulator [Frankia sp.]|nr:BlaI/MecI/CopY family transcriptional regulator [Frankia sp.]
MDRDSADDGACASGGPVRRPRRRSPGTLETEILNVLHAAQAELSPAQVRERLENGDALSYSAVVTTLTRLHGKGVVTRRRAGRAFLYLAKSDAASLIAWRMNRLLDEQADHRPALTHFVATLSPSDEALIRQLLAEPALPADQAGGNDGAGATGTPDRPADA